MVPFENIGLAWRLVRYLRSADPGSRWNCRLGRFTKKGGHPVLGIEKQIVSSAYLRQSGHKFLHAGFRDAYRQWPREPIRFTAKAPHADELYPLNFSTSFVVLDQLHDFRLYLACWERRPCVFVFMS